MLTNCLLCEELLSLLNALVEKIEVGDVSLNFKNWQVDQHTGDLGCILWPNNFGYKFEDAASDCLLVAGVDFDNGRVDGHGLTVELM